MLFAPGVEGKVAKGPARMTPLEPVPSETGAANDCRPRPSFERFCLLSPCPGLRELVQHLVIYHDDALLAPLGAQQELLRRLESCLQPLIFRVHGAVR